MSSSQEILIRPDSEKTPKKSPDFMADNFLPTIPKESLFENLPPELSGWIDLFMKLQVEGIKSDRTLTSTKNDLLKFRIFFEDYLKSDDIRNWIPRVSNRFSESLIASGLKPRTVKRHLASLSGLSKWVMSVRPDLFPLGNPTKGVKAPIQESMRPKGLTEWQVKRLLDAGYLMIRQNYPDQRVSGVSPQKEAWYDKTHRSMRRPFRDYAILLLLVNGGIRREEVCNLDLKQLQGKHIRQIKCKGNQYRDIILGEETLKAIDVYSNEERVRDRDHFQSPALFLPSGSRKHRNRSGRLSVRTINEILRRITETANLNLKEAERFSVHPHQLRHTHAYKLLKEGRSLSYLQKRLGHLSMNYLSLYTQMPEEEEIELLNDSEFR